MAASFDTRRDTFPGRSAPKVRKAAAPRGREARVERVLRALGITRGEFKRRFGSGSTKSTITDTELRKAEQAAAVMGDDEYAAEAVPFDAHFGGTGIKLARPVDPPGTPRLEMDANDLAYRLKRFKRELTQSIDSRERLREIERTGVLPKSERPVQLVRDCSTAGPGWTHCDLTVEGQCPDEKDIVGTPYENVYSSIGQPPNNKIVQCVPPELVRLGKTAEKSEEEKLNKRFYNAVSIISKESENIRRLSDWREVAPCGAIPSMAFAKNDAMCDRLHFKDDRASPRCMTWHTATKLGDKKTRDKAEEAKANPDLRTCFSNPAEVTRKINADIRELEVLRQRLRGAVERSMSVSNFSTRFNLLASRLVEKYPNHALKAENHDIPIAFSWAMVKDYMLNTPCLLYTSPSPRD